MCVHLCVYFRNGIINVQPHAVWQIEARRVMTIKYVVYDIHMERRSVLNKYTRHTL